MRWRVGPAGAAQPRPPQRRQPPLPPAEPAAGASAAADARERAGQAQGAAAAAGAVQRQGRRHLPRVPRRRDRRATRARRSSRASTRIARDKRAPFGPGGLQCEACHGPGATPRGAARSPQSINSLKASSSQTAQERNQTCLGCHQAGARIGWHASTHERSNARLRRLPPDPPGPRPGAREGRASPTSASPATGRSAPTSRSRRPTRCASA